MKSAESAEFSGWRAYLWPIHRHELTKLVPMLLIFFLISFNYNVLRVMKDTLVVTSTSSGPESIPFIKVWAMFPGAIFMTWLFTRLSNKFPRETVFYVIMTIFLGFFFFFAFFLYPNREIIHLHNYAETLQDILPIGCQGMVSMLDQWSFTLFYAMSELWGNIVMFVLFWSFANQILSLNEAKRFYGALGVGANFSGIIAGLISCWLGNHTLETELFYGKEAWEQTQFLLLSLVLLSGIASMLILRWMYRKGICSDENLQTTTKEWEEKLSFRESISYVWKSKYLFCIAIIVVTYNVVINLVEVLWKHEVKALYSDPNSYNVYMNEVTISIGIVASLASLLISSNALRYCGWTWTAMITPFVLLGTSILFFGTFFLNQFWYKGGLEVLPYIVFFGSLQNVLSRGAKYSVFDATKEVAFVPLGDECKLKGKAAIDGIGSRFGKSGGSMLQQILFVLFSGLMGSTPYIAMILLLMISIWMGAVQRLGQLFKTYDATEKQPLKV